jgi:parallel beta-helix repeat protein
MRLITFFMSIWIFLSVLSPLSTACINPEKTDSFTVSVVFCSGNYSISSLSAGASDITIDCNNSLLTCMPYNNLNTGILIEEKQNVIIKNCRVTGCMNGIYITSSNGISFFDNSIIENKIGLAIEDSSISELKRNTIMRNNRSVVITASTEDIMIIEKMLSDNTYDTPELIQVKEEEDNPSGAVIVPTDKTKDSQEDYYSDVTGEIVSKEEKFIEDEKTLSLLTEIIEKEFGDISDEEREELLTIALDGYKEYMKKIHIQRNFYETKEGIGITVSIDSNETLHNVSLYEYIPKCAAEYYDEIEFKETYTEVTNPDPLIMWKFQKLNEQDISYVIHKKLSPDCKELFKTIVLESKFGRLIEKKSAEHNRMIYYISISVIIFIIGFFFFRIRMRY